MPGTKHAAYDVPTDDLKDLERVLVQEIPMCAQMNMQVAGHSHQGLEVSMPLELNRNHQQTAFAGSLNALCTIAGWGTTWLLLRRIQQPGGIVIRRSTIRYHVPVSASVVIARCLPVEPEAEQYFTEMYRDKGQSKLDLRIEIPGANGPAVSFAGSYVVTR